MSQSFYKLQLIDKIVETPDAVSLVFDVPEDLRSTFTFRSGQYITIKHTIQGKEVRRSYSICTAPYEAQLKVNVKQVKGGLMSTWILDELATGDVIEIGVPEGNFTADFDAAKRRHHYFIAAGSGITPCISLIKDGLETEPMSTFSLLFGNRSEEHIIFKKELDEIKTRFGNQFQLFHTLSQNRSLGGRLMGLWSKQSWDGWTGRINEGKVDRMLSEVVPHKFENHFYLCGPGEMITSVQKWLKAQAFPGGVVHKEYFANPDQSPGGVLTTKEAKLTYTNLHGENGTVTVPAGKTILEALMDAGVDPPYSCMNGVCSSCVAKKVKGDVEMDTCLALEDEEIEAGYILTCQSHPLTDEIELEYEG